MNFFITLLATLSLYSNLDPKLVTIIKEVEVELGIDVIINSGHRTPEHNEAVGGTPKSSHLHGYAVDIKMPEDGWRPVVEALRKRGVTRFGIYPNHIHFDIDPNKNDATWYGSY